MKVNVEPGQTDVTEQDLGELQSQLRDAEQVFSEARQATSIARNRETDALNRVNGIQKKIDAVVHGLRLQSSSETDWGKPDR